MVTDSVEDRLGLALGDDGHGVLADLEAQRLLAKVRSRLADVQEPVKLGRYTLQGKLGAGAMGVVYSARDDELGRDVAIKVISLDGQRTPRDIIGEARALAGLTHANIVEVFDVVEADDYLGIVMERIEGQPLSRWLQGDPDAAQILQAFTEAGAALAAAHAAGICHRDFKPHNVVLGDDGRARLVDFGLASLEDPNARVGTPRYAAPEVTRGEGSDHRSDQYSFCVALQDALTGRHLHGPSAATGHRLPHRVKRVLLRGLDPDPRRRYPSMAHLLVDLQPRRHRLRWLAGLATLAVASAAVWPSAPARCELGERALDRVWNEARSKSVAASFRRATPHAALAEQTAQRLDPVLEQYRSAWLTARTEACETGDTAHLRCLRGALVRLDGMLDVLEHADQSVVQAAASAVRRLPDPSSCEASESSMPLSPTRAGDATARSRLDHARTLYDLGRYRDALQESLSVGEHARSGAQGAALAEARWLEGLARSELGDSDAALEALRDAYWTARRLGLDDIGVRTASALVVEVGLRADLEEAEQWRRHAAAWIERGQVPADVRAALHINWGTALQINGRRPEALVEQRSGLDLMRSAVGDDDPRLGACHTALASNLMGLGRFGEAEEHELAALEIYAAGLGPDHPRVAMGHQNLGGIYTGLGRFEEAQTHLLTALKMQEAYFGAVHPNVSSTRLTLAFLESERGDLDAALSLYEQAAKDLEAAGSPLADVAHGGIANTLARAGRLEEAIDAQRSIVEHRRANAGAGSPVTLGAELNLAEYMLEAGRVESAHDAVVAVRRNLGTDPPERLVASLERAEGLVALQRGELGHAEKTLERALHRDVFSPTERAWIRFGLARALAPTDLERALAEARTAREALRGLESQRNEVEAWLHLHEPASPTRPPLDHTPPS